MRTLVFVHALLERDDRQTFTVRKVIPGVTVIRFAGERPLMRAVPEFYGMTMHLVGRSRWRSGGEEWSSAPGTVSLKVPGEAAVEQEREGSVAFQVVLFDAALVDEARAALDRPTATARRHAVDPGDPRAKPLFALHHRLLDEEPAHALEEATCEALHALVYVMSASRAGGAETGRRIRGSAAVARARALLDEHFTETVGLEELAAHARLDKFRLCRSFREEVGLPPHAYVTHRRVARAQSLLARGVSQAEVAARVGFYDQSLLHRHFKRILHITPGAFVRASRV